MYPKTFEYYRATDVSDLLSFLDSHADAKVIAGGQSLVPMMKLRLGNVPFIVDIGRISELRYIKEEDSEKSPNGKIIRIGALATHDSILESPIVRQRVPLLASTAENIGDIQIRDLGTIGGSLCHADPSADYFPTLLILNAELGLRSRTQGARVVPISDFVLGPFETVLEKGEILEEVTVTPYSGSASVEKFARRKADFAVVCVAMILDMGGDLVRDFRIALGPMQNSAVRLLKLETALKNKKFSDLSSLMSTAENALDAEELDFPSDIHGSSWYRGEVAKTIVSRMLEGLYEKEKRREQR